jgi:hypothetical protein
MTYYLVELYEERVSEREKQYDIITSNIIGPNIANIIANWIDRNDSAVLSPNNKYKFNSIYSMSRDGLNNVTFYSKCNGQGPFVVLVRVQSKKIYGGYNPIGYTAEGNNNKWLSATESFIFSFENDQDTNNMKISRVASNATCAVYDYVNYGGFFNFGGDLYIAGQNLLVGHNKSHYNNSFNQSGFSIEEIEAFTI